MATEIESLHNFNRDATNRLIDITDSLHRLQVTHAKALKKRGYRDSVEAVKKAKLLEKLQETYNELHQQLFLIRRALSPPSSD